MKKALRMCAIIWAFGVLWGGSACLGTGADKASVGDADDVGGDAIDRDIAEESDPGQNGSDVESDVDADSPTPLGPAEHDVCGLGVDEQSAETCRIQQQTTFGDCGEEIGAVFDGEQCVPAFGCNCEGSEECPAFDSLEQCAAGCSDAGWCQPERMPIMWSSPPTDSCPGAHCSLMMAMCAAAGGEIGEFERVVAEVLPDFDVSCSDDLGSCVPFRGMEQCDAPDWCCELNGPSTINEETHRQFCSLSLLPQVRAVGCDMLE